MGCFKTERLWGQQRPAKVSTLSLVSIAILIAQQWLSSAAAAHSCHAYASEAAMQCLLLRHLPALPYSTIRQPASCADLHWIFSAHTLSLPAVPYVPRQCPSASPVCYGRPLCGTRCGLQ